MPDPAAIDPEAIENLRALSPDTDGSFLRELITIYLEDTPQRLAEIDASLATKDGPALLRAAHTIKGSSGNFGATQFAKLAQEIETQAKAGDFTAAAAAVTGLKAEYARVTEVLTRIAGGT